jgi:L,D-peptidoglycan transpeptidase YkuD (ErfK/YbiS/YcfS/YnhG family)
MEEKNIKVYSSGTLVFKEKEYKCSLGKNGIAVNKVEGDGKTPVGCFEMRNVLFRPDKLENIETKLETKELKEIDAWCDDPSHDEYNTFVKLPHSGSHEKLWRDDYLYDIILPLGYNDNPPVKGLGSAIFMHVAREGYTGTEGCIGLSQDDMLEILSKVSGDTKVCIIDNEQGEE